MNDMEIQYPVGQGGLHLGIIRKTAYIYDCGCADDLKNPNELRRCGKYIDEIANLLKDTSKLYIFISHLHLEHCNGLHYLLKKIDNKRLETEIYIPDITAQDKIYLLLTATINHEDYSYYYNLVTSGKIEGREDVKIIKLSEESWKEGEKKLLKKELNTLLTGFYTLLLKAAIPNT